MQSIYLTIALAPLVGRDHRRACSAGRIGRAGAQRVTIAGVALSCALSLYVLYEMLFDGMAHASTAPCTPGWSATA